jgi:hypothetical protein
VTQKLYTLLAVLAGAFIGAVVGCVSGFVLGFVLSAVFSAYYPPSQFNGWSGMAITFWLMIFGIVGCGGVGMEIGYRTAARQRN